MNFDIEQFVIDLKSTILTKHYVHKLSIATIASFWKYNNCLTSVCHLIMEYTPLDKITNVWENIFDKFSDVGKRRILSAIWLNSENKTPVDCLLLRDDILSTKNSRILKWICDLFKRGDITIYLTSLPIELKLSLTPDYMPVEIQYIISSYI